MQPMDSKLRDVLEQLVLDNSLQQELATVIKDLNYTAEELGLEDFIDQDDE